MALALLLYILQVEKGTGRVGGSEFRLATIRKSADVPKSTFYRAIQILIEMKMIIRVSRDVYRLHPGFKALCFEAGGK